MPSLLPLTVRLIVAVLGDGAGWLAHLSDKLQTEKEEEMHMGDALIKKVSKLI